jgi:queuine tRNA-ribosyltransferase
MSAPVTNSASGATPGRFEVLARVADGSARRGRLHTNHGAFDTPMFMPVATAGTVKGLTPRQLREDVGAQILLANTYHLALRPGAERVQRLGGLHRFMGWDGPILTDSGGFQIFSLSALRKVTDEGVEFRSHIDGAKLFLSPEDVIGVQGALGVDIAMVLDECVAADADRRNAESAAWRTVEWARRCLDTERLPGQLLFAIVQGGMFADLRAENAAALVDLDFPGYAVGGLSVGEARDVMIELAAESVAPLPFDRPRYLMGVGLPEDLIRFVGMGYDMFDCVLPTRNGRNGMLFTSRGRVNLRLARHADDERPADPACSCYTCANFPLAYLRHLAVAGEMLGPQLASLHNLHFYLNLMREMRGAIEAGDFHAWSTQRIAELEEGSKP